MTDGVSEYQLVSWDEFVLFIQREHLTYGNYLWRGQTEDWPLASSLDRHLRDNGRLPTEQEYSAQAGRFREAMRGRREAPILPDSEESDDDFWAMGQHHGLKTPLLDWSTSPFVAAFFAFEEEGSTEVPYRWVFGLNYLAVETRNEQIRSGGFGGTHIPLRTFRPRTGDNARLLAQAGVFTKGPAGVDAEAWVRSYFCGAKKYYRFLRLLVPSIDREVALRALNRMNINHKTLFPDASGAGRYCNMCISIRHYEVPEGFGLEPDPPVALSDVIPPTPKAPKSLGYSLDSLTIVSLARSGGLLTQIEEDVAAALPAHRERRNLNLLKEDEFAFEVALLRAAKMSRTGDIESFIASLSRTDLVAFLTDLNGGLRAVREGFSIILLALAALARRHTETDMVKAYYAAPGAPSRTPELESKLSELRSKAMAIAEVSRTSP